MSQNNGECTYLAINDERLAPSSPSESGATYSLRDHLRRSLESFRRLTCLQVIAVIICVLLNIISGSGQLLTLNLLVASFPTNGPNINVPFTILTMSSTFSAIIVLVAFTIWCAVKRPSLRFLCTWKAVYLSFGVGFSVAINGVLVVSATGNVPEILQAFLLSTTVVWTFLFVKVMFGEKRSYKSPLIFLSFILSLGGILVGSASKFTASGMSLNTGLWTLIFAAGLIPGALNGVVSAKYMRDFTLSDEETAAADARKISKRLLDENDYLIRKSDAAVAVDSGLAVPAPRIATDAGTAKFAYLAFGSLWQCVLMFVLLPVSVLPWFGTSPDMASLGDGLANGYSCALAQAPGCEGALTFTLLFLTMFILNSVASMFLNYYSPALTSMVNELTAPFAALSLIIIPALNVRHKAYNIGESLGAVLLISAGAVLYTVWEESTRAGEHAAVAPSASSDGAPQAASVVGKSDLNSAI